MKIDKKKDHKSYSDRRFESSRGENDQVSVEEGAEER